MIDQRAIGMQFLDFLKQMPDRRARIHILTDSDADGLPAAVILVKALKQVGYTETAAEVRLKFESAWSPAVLERLQILAPDALIVTDLAIAGSSSPIWNPTQCRTHHGVP